ncbi:MAG: N-acetylmuramoyl-L-alanine amidase [Chloroflexota bacterium]
MIRRALIALIALSALLALSGVATWPGPTALAQDQPCEKASPGPLPARGSPGSEEFWRAFREPLPPAPVWNPAGRKKVGLQAGHWRVDEIPAELRGVGAGSSAAGRDEWDVNLDIAQRTAEILRGFEIDAEVLPATVPVNYRAHVFLSIHADGDTSGALSGFKLGRPVFSATPEADDRLVSALYATYQDATGLARDDDHVSRRMTSYYAFNSRRYCHAVAPGVPSAIIETGYMTSASDRQILFGAPELAARGIADGLRRYLQVDGPQQN